MHCFLEASSSSQRGRNRGREEKTRQIAARFDYLIVTIHKTISYMSHSSTSDKQDREQIQPAHIDSARGMDRYVTVSPQLSSVNQSERIAEAKAQKREEREIL